MPEFFVKSPRWDVGNRRLLTLADFLWELPRKLFDYETYIGNSRVKLEPVATCGTTACALGWATVVPSIRRAGLRLVNGTPFTKNEQYGSLAGFEIFGLSPDEFSFLFFPIYKERGATPKYVARKIRKLVKARTEMGRPLFDGEIDRS